MYKSRKLWSLGEICRLYKVKSLNNDDTKEAIKIFQEKKVRTIWDREAEKWYFSIVDVVSVLTDVNIGTS